MPVTLETTADKLPYVGPNYLKRLQRLGIENTKDLIYHFPHRYDDFSKITPIDKIALNEKITLQGKIVEIKTARTFKRRMTLTEAIIEDQTGSLKVVWFNQPYIANYLSKGKIVSLSGKVKASKDDWILSNPAYEVLRSTTKTLHTARLVPVYPETEGLSSRWLRYKIQTVINLVSKIPDFLPPEIKKAQKLFDLPKALKEIHFPQDEKTAKEAKCRLAFDELFLIQLFSLTQKKQWQAQKSHSIKFPEEKIKEFVASLPFKLTNAQRIAAWQIFKDMEKNKPMNRLLEGDVGSGKTVVAALASLAAIYHGFQAAFMAPTEILAKQHFENLSKLLQDTNIDIGLLTSSEAALNHHGKISKTELIKTLANGETALAIGTHSLIQEHVSFKKLALVIIDEQHRFGVEQRAILQQRIIQGDEDTIIPHLLTMTATPIPRTLALTIYGDLDLSILNEMPKGRQEIITKIVAPANRPLAYEFIRKQITQGRQAFVICPRIEAEEDSADANVSSAPFQGSSYRAALAREIKSVEEEYEKLSKKIFPDLRIAKLHGKLKPQDKNSIMSQFKNHEFDIVVATSVVEVGIDVPNATVMMIEGAERFGLAQLHQFRGRVGRGEYQSYCFLFTDSTSSTTHKRLKAIATAKSGFELAEKDLEIRGPGEFLGTRQWGMPDLTMASLNDRELITRAREEAIKILEKNKTLSSYPALQKELKKFQEKIHFE